MKQTLKIIAVSALATAAITHDTNGTLVTFDPPGLLGVLTVHTIGLVFSDSASTIRSSTSQDWRVRKASRPKGR